MNILYFQIDLAARALLNVGNNSIFDSAISRGHIGSFFPFTHWRTQMKVPPSSLLVNNSLNLNNSDTLDTQSVMTVSDY